MYLKKFMNFDVKLSLPQGYLITVKRTFWVENSFTILIGAINLLVHFDFKLNVTFCTLGAK